MKKVIIVILFLFSINVHAESFNLNDIKDNYENITYVEITNLDNIDNIKNLVNLREVYIKNVDIKDISFLNNLPKLKRVKIYYSKVDLTKINNPTINEMDIISSYIVNDDFSHLANSNLKILDLEGSYVTNIDTLKNVISLEELSLSSISNLKSLEAVTHLPKLEVLNFGGSEDLITKEVLNYIRKNNIVGTNYDETKYMYLDGDKLNEDLDNIIKELNLDNLPTIDKIRKITLYVVDSLEYDEDCGVNNKCEYSDINFNRLLKSLSGSGVCYHYALLTNELLNRAGIKSYLVSGYTLRGLGHAWLNIYIDGKWYGLDPTWIEFEGRSTKLRNTGKCAYFMVELTENSSFYTEHLEDVLPSDIVDVNKIDYVGNNDNIKTQEEPNIYGFIFVVFIVIFIIFVIYVIYRKLNRKRNYKSYNLKQIIKK